MVGHPASRARWSILPFLVLALGPPRAGAAATLFYLHSEPGVSTPAAGVSLLTPAAGTMTAQTSSGHVIVQFSGTDAIARATFRGPGGAALVPGAYENADRFGTSGPRLDVASAGIGCNRVSGRFVVHEAVFGAGGDVVAFAADFEQHCDGAAPALFGAVRYRSGDVACGAAPDGTPCDDHDPCTSDDACRAGECAGTDTVGPTCAAPGVCEAAGVCDRLTAACAYGSARDGMICVADACTTAGTCQRGACQGQPIDCDDGSACTTDGCDPPTGCTHTAVPGTCWVARPVLTGTGTGSAGGTTATCTLRCRAAESGTLVLDPAGTFRSPGGQFAGCPGGESVEVPDEVGVVRRGRRGRLVLETTNLDEILPVARACVGARVRVLRYRTWVREKAGGTRLVGRSVLRYRLPGRVPVTGRIVQRFTAVPGLGPSGPVEAPIVRRKLRECTPGLQPRCTTY